MKPTSPLLWAALGLCMCSAPPKPQPQVEPSQLARNDSAHAAVEAASHDLEQAVLSHDKPAILALLDPDYKTQELMGFRRGNSDTFLNAFFCGKVVNTDQLYCLEFQDILAIRSTGMDIQEEFALVTYTVKSSTHEIETRLKVTLRKGLAPGFVGSQGFTQVEGSGYRK